MCRGISLFGLRKIGKTSLLKEFAYRLLTTVQPEGEGERFWRKWSGISMSAISEWPPNWG